MATAVLDLFKNCKIVPEKNFYVEDIQSYLSQIPVEDRHFITGFQYQKIGLNMSVKCDLPQDNQHDDEDSNWNYARIIEDAHWYYFFIVGKRWISENCIQFDLIMDTLNTFRIGEDYDFNAKTKILREHKDRLKPEGLEVVYYEVGDTPVLENGVWYLMGDSRINYPYYQAQYYYTTNGVNIRVQLRDDNMNVEWDSFEEGLTPDGIYFDVDNQTIILQDGIVGVAQFPYSMSNKLLVRFSDVSILSTNDSYKSCVLAYIQNKVSRVIDEQSEGINPLLLGHDALELNDEDERWYLIYKTTSAMSSMTDNIPVQVLLCSDRERVADLISANATVTAADLTPGRFYYFTFGIGLTPNCIPDAQDGHHPYITQIITDSGNYDVGILPINEDRGKYRQKVLLFYLDTDDPTKIRWQIFLLNRFNIVIAGTKVEDTTSSLSFRQGKVLVTEKNNLISVDWNTVVDVHGYLGMKKITGTLSTYTVKSISSVNKSDQTLLNITELPYCPVNDFSQLYYDSDTHLLTFNNISNDLYNIKLISNKSIDTEDKYNPYNIFVHDVVISADSLRDDNNESKLYHSDYYQPRFVYDSNSYTFMNEYYNGEKVYRDTFDFEYCVSSQGKSNMAFIFPQWELKKQSNNYEVLCTNRNNNVSIYNSNYFNYLNIGYGNDVKEKNTQMGKNAATTTITTLAAIGSAIATAATHGAAAPVAAAITLSATSITSAINLVASDLQAERNIAQKLNEARNQAASISGSDDLDIFNFYANNKAKLMLWECSDNMKEKLADLFFYCGYVCDYQGVPDISSRYRFNYVQCEPVLDNDAIAEDRKNDLIGRWALGVTILHNHSGWDFAQKYENWENALL